MPRTIATATLGAPPDVTNAAASESAIRRTAAGFGRVWAVSGCASEHNQHCQSDGTRHTGLHEAG